MDEFLFNESMQKQEPETKPLIFSNKTWVTYPDNNGKSYTSKKVNFDLNNINTGDQYINMAESLLQIPLVLSVQLTGGDGVKDPLAVTEYAREMAFMKNGIQNIVNAINFKINGNEVINFDSMENLKINFKNVTRATYDSVVKKGSDLHFEIDNSDEYEYNTSYGVYNNLPSNNSNKRRQNRTKLIGGSNTSHLDSVFCTESILKTTLNDYCVVGARAVNIRVLNYYYLAQFKLGDIHDMFKEMPLVKNMSMYLSLDLNINTDVDITVATAANYATTITSYSLSNQTNTLPFNMNFKAASTTTGLGDGTTNNVNVKANLNVAVGKYGGAQHELQNCQLQLCYVGLNDEYNAHYLQNPIRSIYYNETYAQHGTNFSDIPVNGTVNQLIAGNFRKLRRLIIIPYLSATTNGTLQISPVQSVFASEPSTTSPSMKAVDQLQIRVGTHNVYASAIQYDWQMFNNEIQALSNAGGLVNELCTGLISRNDWIICQGYRVVDLSRVPTESDLEAKQVTVQFRNNSRKNMDYVILVEYEKSLMIDVMSGNLVR